MDNHIGGEIGLDIDRLTAAMLKAASIRRKVISETVEAPHVADDLDQLEDVLRNLGSILRRVQEEPYPTTPLTGHE